MAESAASFLVNQLTLFIQQEQELLGVIGDNAVYIRDQLGQMRAFLRAADEKEESDPQLKEWVKQVREISYDTEDVLERYYFSRDAYGWRRYINKMFGSVKQLMVRRQVGSEFQNIKLRMENATKFLKYTDFKDQASSSETYDTRGDALLLEDEEVVGIKEPKEQLVKWLMQTDEGLTVISVVGMAGLGKTTLVKKIYDDPSINANFDISESILKRCEGLPLAIVVIGGLLATKNNNFEYWKRFERTIGLELQEDYLKRLNRLMSLSYYDLPYYLKACFLYLSIFPEDELIEKRTVIELWIAEGFVEAKDGKTLEEVAEAYLTELLNRSLIQVALKDLDERPFSFHIHDILREYIISKSREQNLITVCNGGEMTWPDKIRRMTIHSRFRETETFRSYKYLRSLFWFKCEDPEFGLKLLRRCRLLKVLNFNGTPIDSIPTEVFQLYHLKYLGLRGTHISVIPKSIGNLQNLETLDLEPSDVTEFPIEILKLHKIRHLKVSPYGLSDINGEGFKAPYEIGSYLTSLQTLYRIDADEANGIKIVQEVGKLTQLRCLGITKLRREDAKDLCLSLVKLTNLQSLYVSCINKDEEIDLDHSLSLPFLREIRLQGHLEKFPQWVSSIHGLAVVRLSGSRLREDPLQYLEDLPNLVCLQMMKRPYEGEELIFKGGKFQKLENMTLNGLIELRCVRVEKDSMPHLRRLAVWFCERMDELPEGIEQLENLQIVHFAKMSEKFNGRVVEQKHKGGHEWKLAHVARVVIR